MEGLFAFSLSQQGKTHVDRGVVCQDYSDTFSDERCAVIAVSDGHGSENFVRSDRGSKYACEAALEAAADFLSSIVVLEPQRLSAGEDGDPHVYDISAFDELHKILCADDQEEVIVQLCKNILARWNEKVRLDYEGSPFSEEEVKNVSEKYRAGYLRGEKPEHAYGATLQIAILTRHYFLGIRNGDGECVTIDRDGHFHTPIPENDSCEANYTTSLCDSSAIDDFRYVLIFEDDQAFPLSVFLGSDGVDNSYTSNDELFALYRNIARKALNSGPDEMVEDVTHALEVLTNRGSGDDVSIAGILDMSQLPRIAIILENDAELRRKALEDQKEQKKRAQKDRERARLGKKLDSLATEYKNLEKEVLGLKRRTILGFGKKDQQDYEALILKHRKLCEEIESVCKALAEIKGIESCQLDEMFGRLRNRITETGPERIMATGEKTGTPSEEGMESDEDGLNNEQDSCEDRELVSEGEIADEKIEPNSNEETVTEACVEDAHEHE